MSLYSLLNAVIRRSVRAIDPGSPTAGKAKRVASHYQHPRPGIDRVPAEVGREHARIATECASFLAKLKQDPVSCLNLRFLEGKGIVADPIEFGGRIPAIIELTDSHFGEAAAGEWSPPEHQEGGTTIEPVVGCVMSPWGVMVAFRVAHRDVGSRLKLDWFKKSDPAASPIYLVDPVNHQYLYPIASSMKGDVLPGIPRTGIVVFQMPDSPTDRLQVHFSGVLVSRDRNKTSFSLEYTDQNLPHIIEHFKSLPTMSQQLTTMLDREFRNLRSELLK